MAPLLRFRIRTRVEWLGLAVVLLGVAALLGYIFRLRALVQFGSSGALVFYAAVSFVLGGLILLWPAMGGGGEDAIAPRLLAAVLAVLNAAELIESLSGANLRLDWPELHTWLADLNPHPGRMAPNASLGFLLFAVAVLLLPYTRSRRGSRPVRILTLLVVLLGATAFLSDLLGLEALYSFGGIVGMPLPAAAGMLVLGWGLWLSWRERAWNRSPLFAASGRPILSMAALVLAVVAIIAGLSGFYLLQKLAKQDAVTDLSLRREDRAYYVSLELRTANDRAVMYAQRPELARALQAAAAGASVPAAAVALPRDFAAVRLFDARGQLVAQDGRIVLNPALALPLQLPHPAELLWERGYTLRQRAPVLGRGRRLGTVVTEQPLPLLGTVGVSTAGWGKSGETELCGRPSPQSPVLECFPQRLQPQPYALPRQLHGPGSRPRPMTLALEGESGVTEGIDYRGHRVIAAYSPIAGTGLGLVVKMDTSELYAPIRSQFEIMLPLLTLLTLGSLELLRWQLRPMVQDLVSSRNEAIYNEARFRAAAESSIDGFYIFASVHDPHTGAIVDFRLSYINPPGERLSGLDQRQALGRGISAFSQIEPHVDMVEKLARVVRTREPLEQEYAVRTPGAALWLYSQAVPLGDGVAITLRDITARKRQEARLTRLAENDALTGLPNRRAFLARLEHSIENARQHAHPLLALLFLDIDRFKQINDALGHIQGDSLLQIFAARVGSCVRTVDMMARMGGDEFTVLLEHLSAPEDAERVVAAIFAALIPPVKLSGRSVVVNTSIGLAFYRGGDITAAELLERADEALYQAKRAGRNRYRVYDSPAVGT